MVEQFRQFLTTAWLNARPADMLDIAFVAVVLYYVLSWVHRRVSAAVAVGVVVVLGTYVAVEVLDLYLSSFVFQAGLTVVVFGFLLVFQEDVRSVFERLRNRATGASEWRGGDHQYLDDIAEAAEELAANSTGALMVLEGEESIDVHTHGGVPLEGRVTVPLLVTLFQPETPAHDGAVTISDGQLQKFSVHLPLSTDDRQVDEGGTRHGAALGLAERCDATVVVVSEERGVISIAEDGRLEELSDVSQLRARLGTASRDGGREARPSRWWRFFRKGLGFKVLSVGLATILWLAFASPRTSVQRTFELPIEYQNVPEHLAVDSRKPITGQVELHGPSRALGEITPHNLSISLDVAGREPGLATFVLSGEELKLPRGVTVASIEPSKLQLRLFEMTATSLPVEIRTRGALPKGLELVETSVEPAELQVMVRAKRRHAVRSIPTAAVDLSAIRESTKLETEVAPVRHVRWQDDFDGSVDVSVQVRETASPDAGEPDASQ